MGRNCGSPRRRRNFRLSRRSRATTARYWGTSLAWCVSGGDRRGAVPGGARSRHRLLALASAAAIVAATCFAPPARRGVTAIRDAEIESDIRTLAAPIWRAAGLEPNDVAIYLVSDNQLNSFVAGGQAIFFNTGLILRAENANQLIGVIAHETGHITGGHILRSQAGDAERQHRDDHRDGAGRRRLGGRVAAARRCSEPTGSASARSCNSRSRRSRPPIMRRSIISTAPASRAAAC